MASGVQRFLAASKMAVATMLSRVLGLIREQVMAAYFGASGVTDAFLVAYRIPNLLRDLLAEGAFSSAFVPTLINSLNEGRESARRLFGQVLVILFIVTTFLSGLMIFLAPELVALFAPGFSSDPSKVELTILMVRLMAPFLSLVSLVALFVGVLNALKFFFIPSLTPALFNVVMIAAMIGSPYIMPSEQHPIVALAIGVSVGGIVQLLFQLPWILKVNFLPLFSFETLHLGVGDIFRKLGPGLIGFSANQLNLIVTTVLASQSMVGAVSWLSYAFRLFQLPVGVFSVSLGNSNLVFFSESVQDKNWEKARHLLNSSKNFSDLILYPIAVITFVAAPQIVAIVFERGAFDSESTRMTAMALRYYAIGLPLYGLYKLYIPAMYALNHHKWAVMTSLFSIGLNIVFCWTLTPVYGFSILAIGTTLTMFLNCHLLSFKLAHSLKWKFQQQFGADWFKVVFLSLFLGGVSWNISHLYAPNNGLLAQLSFLLALTITFSSLFLAACVLFRHDQAIKLKQKLFKRSSN